MARSVADWEAIEREYRAGTLSVREIARQNEVSDTAIRLKAKQYGWLRDLSEKVRQELRSKLLCAKLCNENANEGEIVSTNVDQLVKVVDLQRGDIKKQKSIVAILAGQLEQVAQEREDIETTIDKETEGDKDTKRRNSMLKAISLPTHAGVARDLSVALKNLIPLERQAYGIDNGSEGEGTLKIIIENQGD